MRYTFTPEQRNQFFKLFENNHSLKEISEHLQIDYERVKKFLYNHRHFKEKITNNNHDLLPRKCQN